MNDTGNKLCKSATSLLNQLMHVLERIDIKTYQQPIAILSDASIGAHVRHSLEFFACLIESEKSKKVNYDYRKRDAALESEPTSAIEAIKQLIFAMKNIKADNKIALETRLDVNQQLPLQLESSFYRELWYTIEHAIHHFAIIKIGLLSIHPQFQFPENFGIASSTVHYQLTQMQ